MTESLLALATRAHYGTSFVPEQRGRQYVEEYERHLAAMRDWFAENAPAEMVDAMHAEYSEGYARRWKDWMHAKAQCVSPMIAGPSKFPTRRMEKRNATEIRRLDELLQYERNAKRRAHRAAERANRPADPVGALRDEVAEMEQRLAHMKECNAILRRKKLSEAEKIAAIAERTGWGEATARKVVTTPDVFGGFGFPAYELTSLRGKIERRRATLANLERAEASEAVEHDGLRVEEDASENRLRLYFDDKPDEATRALLKRNGFRWAPSAGAWQRQLTDNARAVLRRILPELTNA